MIKQFKIILFIRFLGYFLFLTGLLILVVVLGPLIKAEASYRFDKIRGVKRVVPTIITSEPTQTTPASFAEVSFISEVITPLSVDFGIVIEKINANAKVLPNVNPANEAEYVTALTQGVAHAKGTNFPGEVGNTYLFSHSTDAPWNVVRFNAVFYLLRELELGDRVVIFYQGRRFDYIVFDKVVAEASDISYLTNRYDKPVLTLQTCDPPGTLLKRLVVRAKLAGS